MRREIYSSARDDEMAAAFTTGCVVGGRALVVTVRDADTPGAVAVEGVDAETGARHAGATAASWLSSHGLAEGTLAAAPAADRIRACAALCARLELRGDGSLHVADLEAEALEEAEVEVSAGRATTK